MRAVEFRSSTASAVDCCCDFGRRAIVIGEDAIDRHAILERSMHERLRAGNTFGTILGAATRFPLDTASGAPAASRTSAAVHQASARLRAARLPEED